MENALQNLSPTGWAGSSVPGYPSCHKINPSVTCGSVTFCLNVAGPKRDSSWAENRRLGKHMTRRLQKAITSILFPAVLFHALPVCSLSFSLILCVLLLHSSVSSLLYPQPALWPALPLLPGVHQSLCWFQRSKLLHRYYPPHTRLGTQVHATLLHIYNYI